MRALQNSSSRGSWRDPMDHGGAIHWIILIALIAVVIASIAPG
jgi:hypothetical protein